MAGFRLSARRRLAHCPIPLLVALVLLLSSFLLAGCGTDEAPAEATATTAPVATATTTRPPQPVVVQPTPSPAQAGPTTTPTPIPSATATQPGPTPTAGPLNTPVPTVPTGEYACGDYPCFDDVAAWEARIALPPGFSARYHALVEAHPTSMAFGPDGRLYVARQEGQIVAVDGEGNVTPIVDGFYHLVAIAFEPGTGRLFASSRAPGDDAAILWVIADGEVVPLYDDLPCCYGGWHQANGIAFGPDGYGYVSVGARSDHGENPIHPLEASVLRFDPDGGQIEVWARGLRNTFDIAWDADGRLFGADNSPDHGPPEEFNRIEPGGHHGFPYYSCETCTPAPQELDIVRPLHDLLAHSAPTGVAVYLHEQFPGYYNNIFLALWSAFPGAQKIVRFGPNGEGMTDFATGFAAPVDVVVGPDGSLYVGDWATGIIFEIGHTGAN